MTEDERDSILDIVYGPLDAWHSKVMGLAGRVKAAIDVGRALDEALLRDISRHLEESLNMTAPELLPDGVHLVINGLDRVGLTSKGTRMTLHPSRLDDLQAPFNRFRLWAAVDRLVADLELMIPRTDPGSEDAA